MKKDCCKECKDGKVCLSEVKEAKKKELNKIVLKNENTTVRK